MSDKMQYKNFSTRRFRADLHYRLRIAAATLHITMEEVFNLVVAEGLDVVEVKARAGMKRKEGG